ncbi:VOC family protein [Natronobacterium gregoryi]|uniref:Glyoxalase n=2 Tax=Natronobacterium gregoryi TaxID=44930 RepID=L0ALF7_NATGS|nr:VOC family protein [Natronobacterium gregoryi]AFZ73890.1 lactoylglutathione lyase-like lyase [Natronobacterium gregoryi SP2]ELY64846.1 glyoxalase/bleomycin resistance protein/dioxygenase [Natronobacterium gregoryi SP2]PLK19152.1 glyoxalase [Natronobacterium gregoryi SP2]SFJ59549.1 lactoylglutathione lyase [Natronobacterium gregoryi]
MNGTLDHTMIRVSDLEKSLDWYQTHLEYEEKDRYEGDGFTIVYLGPEEMHEEGAMLEITHNEGEDVELGDAWGHVAVRVPEGELEEHYEQLMDEGVEDYRDPESCGGRYAFVRDPDGHEVEIVQRDVGETWSLDHTMIRVEDADEALGFWTRKFEYDEVGRWEADTFANYFVEPADAADEAMSLELTYNYDGRTYDQGDAWGHLCLRVDDLEGDWDQLVEREAPDYRAPESNDNMYAFTKDQDGHEIELLERDLEAESLFPF